MRALARRLRCCPFSFRFFFYRYFAILMLYACPYIFVFCFFFIFLDIYVYVYLSFCFEYPDASDWTEDVRRSRDIYYTNIWYYVIISPP